MDRQKLQSPLWPRKFRPPLLGIIIIMSSFCIPTPLFRKEGAVSVFLQLFYKDARLSGSLCLAVIIAHVTSGLDVSVSSLVVPPYQKPRMRGWE
ncbi:hypothetical protein L207DRAFT_60553 [Hyaloscypha variabilis F]|uniref:Uncharacterized protein n=1 Tax=Hyaloscypha variabilis (strain UAMH 11265 / GT02V1 / F) TaxID=1149755 RepID=A0A2J6RHU7_HYAVF|nr:hypothetical protein L207DRAFT_60553 [Hyaloscypha variabilis F]